MLRANPGLAKKYAGARDEEGAHTNTLWMEGRRLPTTFLVVAPISEHK